MYNDDDEDKEERFGSIHSDIKYLISRKIKFLISYKPLSLVS